MTTVHLTVITPETNALNKSQPCGIMFILIINLLDEDIQNGEDNIFIYVCTCYAKCGQTCVLPLKTHLRAEDFNRVDLTRSGDGVSGFQSVHCMEPVMRLVIGSITVDPRILE